MSSVARAARLARAAPLLLLPACIDYNPTGKPGEPGLVDDDTSRPDTDTATDTPEDLCDGVDNDGDGRVDEGFPDVDGDALADCVDDTCVVVLDGPEAVSDSHACELTVEPPVDPWNVELLWEAIDDTYCLGIVAGDLEGDGRTEIVCVDINSALVVLDGPTGSVRWEAPIITRGTALALADLDTDGQLEILAYTSSGSVVAVRADGSVFWESPELRRMLGWNLHPIEVASLDPRGPPAVIGSYAALRGDDGSVLARVSGASRREVLQEELAIADLDGDGAVDIVSKSARYATDGSAAWEYLPDNEGRGAATALLLQADGDPDAEIVLTRDESFALFEADGTLAMEHEQQSYAFLPCAGDIDGDGDMELITFGEGVSRAWSLPATLLWQGPFVDPTSGSVGCTTFDFDLDGAKEVVYGDSTALYILDGATGTVLYQHDRISATYDDRILIVDLDGDGSVEIVTTVWSGGTGMNLQVFGNVNRDWPPGTRMWPSATWSGTSLLPDGRVPRTPHKPWLTTKVWRGQPEVPIFGSDLRPAVGDACVSSCEDDGEVRVAVRLQNLGPDEVEAGVPLAVYGLDDTGGRVLLTVFTLADWLDDGRAAASFELVTTTAQAKRGLVFVAGDDGTGSVHPDDCATENSTVEWALTACP